jgi:hypothetical protein
MVKTMNSSKKHKKVLLSGHDDCCVVLCSDCNILELNIGASTLRISPESLHALSSILNNAKNKLDQMHNAALLNGHFESGDIKRVH